MSKDFYQILGVSKTSSADEIKKAYRKLAHQHHPDKQGGDEKKFKEINEAYQTLSNPEKRQQYDHFGSDYAHYGSGQGGFNWSDFSRQYQQGGQNQNIHFDFGDLGGFSDIFESFFGGGGGRRRITLDLELQMRVTFMDAVFGTQKNIEYGKVYYNPDGSVQKQEKAQIKITVPEGINQGQQIRLREAGNVLQDRKGDLYIEFVIEPHPIFKRQGQDIYSEIKIPISLAVLGGKLDTETVDGFVEVKIPVGVHPDSSIRLKGKGVLYLQKRGRGDHYLIMKIQIPSHLSAKQKKLFKELAKEGV